MVFVIHPLTQQSGVPKYTASDFRLTVSNFLTAGTGEAFGAVQGVRSDSFTPHASMAGNTITVHPHSGIIAPWTGVGAYAYAITSDITVPRPTTGDYFVVLVVEDPSQSHGSEPQGRVDLIPLSTPRESVDGLVIARTQGGTINDIANRLRNGTVIETVSKAELDLIKPTPRTRAWVRFGEGIGEYEYDGSNWKPVNKVGSLTPAEYWNDAYIPLRIRLAEGVVTLAGAVRRTGGSFTAETVQPYVIAHVSPAPSARVDVASITNGSGTGGNCTIRIQPDGTVNLINMAAAGINITKGETYVSLGGVTYPID